MHSFYNEGFINILKVNVNGDIILIILSTLLFISQFSLSFLFITDVLSAKQIVMSLTLTNMILPTLVVSSLMYLKCRFSGVPKREDYKSRFKFMHWAISVWSITRIARAFAGFWDISILFGMILDTKSSGALIQGDTAVFIIPMLIIVIFLVVEIWPIWVVIDGNFVDIFLKQSVLIEQKDLMTPLLYGEGKLS